MQRRIVILVACAIGLLCNARADLKLPAIFGDDMVLQRGIELPVWGWAGAGEEVRVQFAGQTKLAVADGHGRWQLKLEPLAVLPEPGGMTVSSSRGGRRVFRNVLVGDVWICSGQSNMQFPVANALNGHQEAAKADLPGIHPRNKQDVGRRLGLAAQAIAHGQAVPFPGPVYANTRPPSV